MQKSEAEALVKKLYGARAKGDVDGVMSLIAADMNYRLFGSTDHSSVPVETEGRSDFRQALTTLVNNFEFEGFTVVKLIVDGDDIAIHWRAIVSNPATGKGGPTDVIDFWTVKDGKVTSIMQAVDTAFAHWMITA